MLGEAGYAVMDTETEDLFKEALNLRPVDVMFKGPKDSVWRGPQVSIADPAQVGTTPIPGFWGIDKVRLR